VTPEFPFQAAAEFDVRIADVAMFRLAEAMQSLKGVYFRGVPDIVIEVLSPSNTASEVLDRETMCLRNGGREFWLVDPRRSTVKVVQADGSSRVYGLDSVIESSVLSGHLPVREIFDSLV
jgi:Uma2 family endonuclease